MSACSATSKRTHQPCRAQAITGRGTCRHHGGRSPRGAASAAFRTGRYSVDLPTRMGQRFENAERDEELLSLRAEVALTDARIGDVLSRADSGESGALWNALGRSWAVFTQARASGDVGRMSEALDDHESLINGGRADYAVWAEIGALVNQRARLVESERRREFELDGLVTVESVLLMLGAATDAISRLVPDREVVAQIGRELALLADGPSSAPVQLRPRPRPPRPSA